MVDIKVGERLKLDSAAFTISVTEQNRIKVLVILKVYLYSVNGYINKQGDV